MFKKSLYFLAVFSVFFVKNAARLTLVIAFYLFKVLGWLMRLMEQVAFKGCVASGVFKVAAAVEPEFEKKFTEEEIEDMAEKFSAKKVTIKEIQEKLGVSYRQARKVQQAVEEALPIHHFSGQAVAA